MQNVFANDHNLLFLTRLQDHLLRYGYLPLETNIIDRADLFLTKAGDQIIDRLFTFQRNGIELAFRPEFTAAAAREYASNNSLKGKVVRWQFAGPVFLADEQGGTTKLSMGAELIGEKSGKADVEIMAAAITGINALGIDSYRLVLGQASLINAILAHFSLDIRTQRFILNHRMILRDAGINEFLDKLHQYLPTNSDAPSISTEDTGADSTGVFEKLVSSQRKHIGRRSPGEIAQRLIRKQKQVSEYERIMEAVVLLEKLFSFNQRATSAFNQLASMLPVTPVITQILANWKATISDLCLYGVTEDLIWIQPDLSLAWDYYTGSMFEIQSKGRTLARGGRYDDLVSLMGNGVEAPAVGFAYDVGNFDAVMDEYKPQILSFNIADNSASDPLTVRWLTLLRDAGINIKVDFSHQDSDLYIQEGLLYMASSNKGYVLDQLDELLRDINSKQRG